MDGHRTGVPQGPGEQNPAYRPARCASPRLLAGRIDPFGGSPARNLTSPLQVPARRTQNLLSMALIGLVFFVVQWVVPIAVVWWLVRTTNEIRQDVRALRDEVAALQDRSSTA